MGARGISRARPGSGSRAARASRSCEPPSCPCPSSGRRPDRRRRAGTGRTTSPRGSTRPGSAGAPSGVACSACPAGPRRPGRGAAPRRGPRGERARPDLSPSGAGAAPPLRDRRRAGSRAPRPPAPEDLHSGPASPAPGRTRGSRGGGRPPSPRGADSARGARRCARRCRGAPRAAARARRGAHRGSRHRFPDEAFPRITARGELPEPGAGPRAPRYLLGRDGRGRTSRKADLVPARSSMAVGCSRDETSQTGG